MRREQHLRSVERTGSEAGGCARGDEAPTPPDSQLIPRYCVMDFEREFSPKRASTNRCLARVRVGTSALPCRRVHVRHSEPSSAAARRKFFTRCPRNAGPFLGAVFTC